MGTNIDYSSVAHQTIYHNITGGSGADPLIEASRAWQDVATKLQKVQDYVDQAVRGIGAAQQGAAADAATQASMPLVPWVANAATVANGLAARISSQADLFAHTKASMPEPRAIPDPAWNQDPGEWAADGLIDWLPGAQTDEERARVQAQQDEQRARDLMIGYQSNSNENLDGRPQFEAAPQVVADLAQAPAQAGGGGGGPASGPYGSGSHPGQAGPVSPASTAPAYAHSPGPAPGPGGGGQVSPSVAPAATQSQLNTGYPAGVQPGITAAQGRAGGQQAPFGPAPTFGGSGVSGQGPRAPLRGAGARGAGSFAAPSRGGGFGPRPAAPSAGPSGAAEPTNVARAAGTGAAARGGSGLGMAPFGGTGGRGGEDGTEHRRPSYLVEQDTNALIGDLPLTAPPVIGDDQGDYR